MDSCFNLSLCLFTPCVTGADLLVVMLASGVSFLHDFLDGTI